MAANWPYTGAMSHRIMFRFLSAIMAVVLALGLLGHGAMAGAMSSPTKAMTMAMTMNDMAPNGCSDCPPYDDGGATGCYAACLGTVFGLTTVQDVQSRMIAARFDEPIASIDRLGRSVSPDTGPPR